MHMHLQPAEQRVDSLEGNVLHMCTLISKQLTLGLGNVLKLISLGTQVAHLGE